MRYFGAAVTDVGNTKKTNQDSVCLKVANSKSHGQIAMAVICDGMGGLELGEVASATVIQHFADWFSYKLPKKLEAFSFERIKDDWNELILSCNKKLVNYGKQCRVDMGTTLTAMLCVDDKYIIVHVGDTRVYELNDEIKQITKDQTFIARELAAGTMTLEEAQKDARRNMLLQCVGVNDDITPEFTYGDVDSNVCYLLCSDGFRHVITEEEMFKELNPGSISNSKDIEDKGRYLIDIVKQRKERDNISMMILKAE